MKILILNGSPRSKGNTSYALGVIAAGFKEHLGGEIETVEVAKLKIGGCTACDACKKNGGDCVMPDGSKSLIDKVYAADVLIMGSPVYWWGISSQLKTVVDKFYSKSPQLHGLKKKVGVIAIGEDELTGLQYKLIHDQFKCICAYLGWEFPLYLSFSAGAPGDLEKTEGAEKTLSEAWNKF